MNVAYLKVYDIIDDIIDIKKNVNKYLLLLISHLISYDLMQEPAILRFDQWGAVAQDCSSAHLNAIQEKTALQRFKLWNEPEAAERCLDKYVNICCTLSSQ